MTTISPPRHRAARSPARTIGDGRGIEPVAVAGELLMMLGALLLLYVAWQLFYTDVQADGAQDQVLDQLGWAADGNAPVTADGNAPVTADDTLPIAAIPDELRHRDMAPPEMGEPAHATTFAAMYVPRWGEDYAKPISQGVTRRDVLDTLGIGHYPDTAMPGGEGNFALAGHRTTYGKPFSDVNTLEVGDALIVQTEDHWFVYRVTDWDIVSPTDVQVIDPVPPGAAEGGRYITLTTCHPRYSAAQRWIVHGELDYWAPTGHGLPPEMLEEMA